MNAREESEKRLDAFWEKHKAELAPVVANSSNEPTTPGWLNISAAAAAQIALLRAEADQEDTSPHMRSRLAKAALKLMGLDDLSSPPARPEQNNLPARLAVGVGRWVFR